MIYAKWFCNKGYYYFQHFQYTRRTWSMQNNYVTKYTTDLILLVNCNSKVKFCIYSEIFGWAAHSKFFMGSFTTLPDTYEQFVGVCFLWFISHAVKHTHAHSNLRSTSDHCHRPRRKVTGEFISQQFGGQNLLPVPENLAKDRNVNDTERRMENTYFRFPFCLYRSFEELKISIVTSLLLKT